MSKHAIKLTDVQKPLVNATRTVVVSGLGPSKKELVLEFAPGLKVVVELKGFTNTEIRQGVTLTLDENGGITTPTEQWLIEATRRTQGCAKYDPNAPQERI